VSEITGTNAIFDSLALTSDARGWHAKTNRWFQQNDPYRRPTTASKHGDLWWPEGYRLMDMPQIHTYDTSDDPVQIADRVAYWSTRMFSGFARPGLIGEFGTQVSSKKAIVPTVKKYTGTKSIPVGEEKFASTGISSRQPMFLHNGIWSGLVSG
jgi:hypothetical protein